MGVLQRFERRIEEMVNRPFARAFKAEVQPVEIAGALQRECDDRAAIVATVMAFTIFLFSDFQLFLFQQFSLTQATIYSPRELMLVQALLRRD